MKCIPYLQTGDTVVIVTPAKKIEESYITKAIQLLESWGLHVEVGAHALGSHYYFSGTDAERAEDMQWALDHPMAKAIICARGGYGSVRIIEELNYKTFTKNPKWIVGFSDITIFHNYIHSRLHLPSIHGAVPLQFDQLPEDSETLQTLRKALFGIDYTISFTDHPQNRVGNVTAPIVGGNLANLVSVVGTWLDISLDGKILFIEEVSEYAYKLDRMLWTLKKSGKLDKLAGLMVGGLTDIKECEETFGMSPEDLIYSFVKEYEYPVAFGFPAGHQVDNRAIILGASYSVEVLKGFCGCKLVNCGKS